MVKNISFGFRNEAGTVSLYTFGPDSEGLPWFVGTGETISLAGRLAVGEASQTASGTCIDTAEWLSPAASLVASALEEAPETAALAVVELQASSGTRSWSEEVNLTFFN